MSRRLPTFCTHGEFERASDAERREWTARLLRMWSDVRQLNADLQADFDRTDSHRQWPES
jgi:hypothetical protein